MALNYNLFTQLQKDRHMCPAILSCFFNQWFSPFQDCCQSYTLWLCTLWTACLVKKEEGPILNSDTYTLQSLSLTTHSPLQKDTHSQLGALTRYILASMTGTDRITALYCRFGGGTKRKGGKSRVSRRNSSHSSSSRGWDKKRREG